MRGSRLLGTLYVLVLSEIWPANSPEVFLGVGVYEVFELLPCPLCLIGRDNGPITDEPCNSGVNFGNGVIRCLVARLVVAENPNRFFEGFARVFPCRRACSAQIIGVLVKNSVPVVPPSARESVFSPGCTLNSSKCMYFSEIDGTGTTLSPLYGCPLIIFRAQHTTGTVFLTKTPKS